MWRWLLVTALIVTFCIGFNFLTLPFAVSPSGFWPGVITSVIIWFFLIVTGLLYLEAILASPEGANVYSISGKLIGPFGKWLSSSVLVILNYAYLIVYTIILSPIICEIINLQGTSITPSACVILLGVLIALFIFCGVTVSLILNFFLMIVLIIFSYLIFASSIPTMESTLRKGNWTFLLLALPTIFNALFYQTILPTAADFLKRNKKLLVSAICTGVSIASLFFIVWFWLIVSHAETFQAQVLVRLDPEDLSYAHLRAFHHLGRWPPYLLCVGTTTAIISIGLLLVDFTSDAFKIPLKQRRGWKRGVITAAIFIPAIVCSFVFQVKILHPLLIIGEIGTLFLGALLPIWWAWILRTQDKPLVKPLVPGGKPFLFILTILSLFLFYLVGLELVYQTF